MDAVVNSWNISSCTGASNITYSDILSQLITENNLTQQLPNADHDLCSGVLCDVCKDLVRCLVRLQTEVTKVKNSIVKLLRNNENIERRVEQEKAEAIYQTIVGKYKNTAKTGDEKVSETPHNQPGNHIKIEGNNLFRNGLDNNTHTKTKEKTKVESLLEKRGYKYLVKWRNCSEMSWEARFALPSPVVKVSFLLVYRVFPSHFLARLGIRLGRGECHVLPS